MWQQWTLCAYGPACSIEFSIMHEVSVATLSCVHAYVHMQPTTTTTTTTTLKPFSYFFFNVFIILYPALGSVKLLFVVCRTPRKTSRHSIATCRLMGYFLLKIYLSIYLASYLASRLSINTFRTLKLYFLCTKHFRMPVTSPATAL